MSAKTVYFELVTETEEQPVGQDFTSEEEALEAEQFDMQVQEITGKLLRIRKEMVKARHLQDQIQAPAVPANSNSRKSPAMPTT